MNKKIILLILTITVVLIFTFINIKNKVINTPFEDQITALSPEKPLITGEPERVHIEKSPQLLYKFHIDEIQSIKIKRSSIETKLQQTGNTWTINGEEIQWMDQEKLLFFVQEIVELNSLYMVGFVKENKEAWGINEDSTLLILETKNEDITLVLGNEDTKGTGNYINIKGTDEVYIVKSSYTSLSRKKPEDFRVDYIKGYSSNEMTKMIVNGQKPMTIKAFEKTDYFTWQGFTHMFETPYGDTRPLDNLKVKKIINEIQKNIPVHQFITRGSPSDYGLDENSQRFIMEDSRGNKLDFQLGDTYEGDKIYGKYTQNDQVFLFKLRDLAFANLNAFDLLDRKLQNISIDEIDTMSINSPQFSMMAQIMHSGFDKSITINGMEIESEQFNYIYEDIQSLEVDGETIKETITANPLITISYKLDDGGLTWTHWYFYDYNTNNYAFARDEEIPLFIISKSQLNDVLLKTQIIVDKIMVF